MVLLNDDGRIRWNKIFSIEVDNSGDKRRIVTVVDEYLIILI